MLFDLPQADALAEAEAEAEAALDDYSSDEYELPAGHTHRKRKRAAGGSPKQPKVKAPPSIQQVLSQQMSRVSSLSRFWIWSG